MKDNENLTPDEIEKKKEERREYKRKWYKKNKEAIQSRQKEYRNHNKEKIKKYQKEWRRKHKAEVQAASLQNCARKAAKVAAYKKKKSKAEKNAYMREWRRKHKAAAQAAYLRYSGKETDEPENEMFAQIKAELHHNSDNE